MATLRTVNAADAQHRFPQILADVCNGAEVIIARGATPIARLTAIARPGAPKHAAKPAPSINNDDAWEQNIAAIQALRKTLVIGPPLTRDEIISARDEGRK